MTMPAYICAACGTQFPESQEPPSLCAICNDPRQFVPADGQQWTTLERLSKNHRNIFHQYEPNLLGIGTTPEFAIGQRALLLQTNSGNFLWDCISLLDPATVKIIKSLGGLRGIAVSHPHFYSSIVAWSQAFDHAPIYLHAADRDWVMRPDPAIKFWEGAQKELAPGVALVHCGGHFPGASALHWAAGADGLGALLTSDTLSVMPDGNVTFMYSYPNAIPLRARAVRTIAAAVAPLNYDRIYGGWWKSVIENKARDVVERSLARYLEAIDAD